MKKPLFAALIALFIVSVLAGCGSSQDTEKEADTDQKKAFLEDSTQLADLLVEIHKWYIPEFSSMIFPDRPAMDGYFPSLRESGYFTEGFVSSTEAYALKTPIKTRDDDYQDSVMTDPVTYTINFTEFEGLEVEHVFINETTASIEYTLSGIQDYDLKGEPQKIDIHIEADFSKLNGKWLFDGATLRSMD